MPLVHLPCLIVWRAIHSLKHRSKWQSLSGIEEKGSRKKIGKIHERRSCFLSCLPPLVLVLAVAEMFASWLFRSIVFLSLSNHLLSSLVCWCSASPCGCSVAKPRAKESSHLLDSITSLFSLLSSLFPLLCDLASLCSFSLLSSLFSLLSSLFCLLLLSSLFSLLSSLFSLPSSLFSLSSVTSLPWV